jgi:hypothetical protein
MKDDIFVKLRPGFAVSVFTVEGKRFPTLFMSRNDIAVAFGSMHRLAEFCSVLLKTRQTSSPDKSTYTEHFSVFDHGEQVELSIACLRSECLRVSLRQDEYSALCDLAQDVQKTILRSGTLPSTNDREGRL